MLTIDRVIQDRTLLTLGAQLDPLDSIINTPGMIRDDHVHKPIDAAEDICEWIAETPASTLSGVLVKARAAAFLYSLGSYPTGLDPADETLVRLHGAIVRDLLRIVEGRG